MCTALSDGEGRAAAGKVKATSGSMASATREQPSGGGGMATRTTAQHALGIETTSAERPCKVPGPGSIESLDDDDERGEEPAARPAMPNGPDARAKKGSGSIAAEPGKRAHGGTPPEAARAATLARVSSGVAARGITGSRTGALTIWTAERCRRRRSAQRARAESWGDRADGEGSGGLASAGRTARAAGGSDGSTHEERSGGGVKTTCIELARGLIWSRCRTAKSHPRMRCIGRLSTTSHGTRKRTAAISSRPEYVPRIRRSLASPLSSLGPA